MSFLKIHKPYVLYDNEKHKYIWLGLDESESEKGILTNQYMIIDHDYGLLIDPGGYFVVERLIDNITDFIPPEKVKAIFYSHQDPDVVGSLNLLLDIFPNATIYISSLWIRFLPHLGALSIKQIHPIPDEGGEIVLGEARLKLIPAHFLHSPGNFTLYDPIAKILFTGDIGAAVYQKQNWYLFVEDFDQHIKLMESFHKRYLANKKALMKWLENIEKLNIKMLTPQHGAIMEGENVKKFIKWLRELDEIGVDYLFK